MSTLRQAAIAWASGEMLGRAVPVFPLRPGGKEPHPGLPTMPEGEGGYKLAVADLDQIAEWWTRWPDANVGIDLARAGLVVIDVEGPSKGFDPEETLARLDAAFGPLPETPRVITSGGGFHLYFASPRTATPRSVPRVVDLATGETIEGVEIKATGYVVVPPSVVRP